MLFKAKLITSAIILTYLSAIALVIVVVVGAFNPGCLAEDTFDQWSQAGVGMYHDWHPATLSILWSWIRRVYDGFQAPLVFQIALFSAGVLLTVRVCQRHLVRISLLFAVAVTPPVFTYLGIISKDSALACFMVLAVGLYYYVRERRSTAAFWAALLVSYLAYSVRHNGIFAVFPFLALLFTEWYRPSRAVILLVLVTLSFPGLERATRAAFRVRHEHPEQALFVYDLSALSLNAGEILVPADFRTPYTSLTRIRQLLSVYNGSDLFFSTGNACKMFITDPAVNRHLMGEWIKAIVKHPIAYIGWRSEVFQAEIGLRPIMIAPYIEGCIVPNAQHLVPVQSIFHQWVMQRLSGVGQSPIFRPYIYLIVLFGIGIFGAWNRRRDIVLIAGSGLSYALAYFVIGSGGAFRYMCCSVFIALLLSARIIAEQVAKRWPSLSDSGSRPKLGQAIGASLLFALAALVVVRAAKPPRLNGRLPRISQPLWDEFRGAGQYALMSDSKWTGEQGRSIAGIRSKSR
jgi:hypothetical protein